MPQPHVLLKDKEVYVVGSTTQVDRASDRDLMFRTSDLADPLDTIDHSLLKAREGSASVNTSLKKRAKASQKAYQEPWRDESALASAYHDLQLKVESLQTELHGLEAQRELQLKQSQALAIRLSTLLDVLPAGVVLIDGQGKVIQSNPAAVSLLGEPLEGELWFNIIKRCFAPKHDDGHEVSLKDGRRVRIETRSMGTQPGQLILLSDLTETRRLQEQVSRAERLSSLGKMVASLAHQIRTPLSTAMLYAGHLRQPVLEDDMRLECSEKLLSRLTHLEHQIRDMLIFAKGETRLAEDLGLREFESALRGAVEPVIENAGATCHWAVDESDRRILCNREALVGACVNIVNNSIEAFEANESRPELHIDIALESLGESGLRLRVTDNGPGIPKDVQSKLMEPFFTTKAQGTGLGLSVVQAVIKAHKGLFRFESSDTGVTSVITLPSHSLNRYADGPVPGAPNMPEKSIRNANQEVSQES